MRIGVDLGGTKIEGILLAPNGEVVEKIRVDTPTEKYSDTVEALCQVVEELQQKALLKQCTVGIGTPGALSAKNKRACDQPQPTSSKLMPLSGLSKISEM